MFHEHDVIVYFSNRGRTFCPKSHQFPGFRLFMGFYINNAEIECEAFTISCHLLKIIVSVVLVHVFFFVVEIKEMKLVKKLLDNNGPYTCYL